MKSLYNKSGILPALFMNSRVDCGIAWSEHRRVEPVKREDVIRVEAPPLSGHIRHENHQKRSNIHPMPHMALFAIAEVGTR